MHAWSLCAIWVFRAYPPISASYTRASNVFSSKNITSGISTHASGLALIASVPFNTSRSFPVWDPNRFGDIIFGTTRPTGLDASYLAAFSAFTQYGREPACTAAFSSFKAVSPSTTTIDQGYSFSNADPPFTVPIRTLTQPAGYPLGYCYQIVSIQIGPRFCCPQRTLSYTHLRVLYWPAAHPNTACLGNATKTTITSSQMASSNLSGTGRYVTDSDGHVYTSPSVYVKFPAVSATDMCGQLGPALTSITLAFAPGELSTSVGIGLYTPGSVLPFNPDDLPCGPPGWNSWLPDYFQYPDRSYQPIIALPRKLLDIVPAWSNCAANAYDGQDPPRTLSPNIAMVPPQTTADTKSPTITAAPSPPMPKMPPKTGDPPHEDMTQNETPSLMGDPASSSADVPFAVADQSQTLTEGGAPVTLARTVMSSQSALLDAGSHANEASVDPSQPGILVIQGKSYTADISSHFLIAGQTLTPAGPAIMISGTPISLVADATAAVVGANTVPTLHDPAAGTPVLTFAGLGFAADAPSTFVIDGQTLTPSTSIEVHRTLISHPSDGGNIVIGGSTQPLSSPHEPSPAVMAPVLTFDGSTYTSDASSAFVIEGHILTPGATIEVNGTRISYPASGSKVLIGTDTQSLSMATITPPAIVAPILTLDGSTYTAGSFSDFIINGQTLLPGSVLTISGTVLSYAADKTAMIINMSTEPVSLATITPSIATATAAVVSFDGSTYTADASSEFTIVGQTLTSNGIITVSGTPIFYAAADKAVIIGTSTEALSYATITPATAPTITFDGSTYTAEGPLPDFVIAGQKLTPGGLITVSGTPISYAAAGTDVVFETSTEGVGIGGLIMSGFRDGSASTGIGGFTGSAVEGRRWSGVVVGIAFRISILMGIYEIIF